MMTPELSRRLGHAIGDHVVSPDERDRIVTAAERPSTVGWASLPRDIQRLVEAIEARPLTVDTLPAVPGPTPLSAAPPSTEPNRFVL